MELIQRINKTSLFVSGITLVAFGAILLQDGLADARHSLPGTAAYWDGKEVAIASALLLLGGLLLIFIFRSLPRVNFRLALVRTGIVLSFGLLLAAGLRVVDLRVEGPYWFTTNSSGYIALPGGSISEGSRVIFRERAQVEGINRAIRAHQGLRRQT